MSELTPCNWCSLRRIREQAKVDNKKVTILHDADWGLGGMNVYVHPKDIDVRKLKGGEDGIRSKYRVTWFKALSKSCCC